MTTYLILGISDVQLGYVSSAAIVDVDLPFANNFQINANVQQIEFVGDGDSESVPIGAGFTGTLAADKFSTEILTAAAGVAAVTTGLPVDEASRYYPEGGSYPFLRARVTLKAKNNETGAVAHLRLEIPKMTLQNPYVPGQAQNNTKLGTELAWAATKTAVDLLDVALPGVPTAGVHYILSELLA